MFTFNYSYNLDAGTYDLIIKNGEKVETFSIDAIGISSNALNILKDNLEDFING